MYLIEAKWVQLERFWGGEEGAVGVVGRERRVRCGLEARAGYLGGSTVRVVQELARKQAVKELTEERNITSKRSMDQQKATVAS